ncbi:MAG TPA: hypothetical protein VLL52_14045 [Anaerolineae bacterium]|nr:hypothetical protein [Anaerolineae bacterium]
MESQHFVLATDHLYPGAVDSFRGAAAAAHDGTSSLCRGRAHHY